MGVKTAPESVLVVAFHDLVIDVGTINLVQVVEDHGGEQTCNTGSDDANFEGFLMLLSLRWSSKAVDDSGNFIAILWCWLRKGEQGPTCQPASEESYQ